MIEEIDFTGFETGEIEPIVSSREDAPIKNLVRDTSDLRSYMLKELNIKDEFVTGNPDSPIKIGVDELTDKQILNIYKYGINKNLPTYSAEEENIIKLIRDGDFEEYIVNNFLQPETAQEYNDFDYYSWKMNNDYPGITDDDIARQYEFEKETDIFDFKINKIKEQYANLVAQQQEQEVQNNNAQEQSFIQEQKQDIINSIKNAQNIEGFDIPESVKKQVLSDLFQSTNGEVSNFIEQYVDNKEGLLYTATAVKMLPLIVKEYEMLLDELETLKNKNKNFIEPNMRNRDYNDDSDIFSDFNAGGFADYLTK